MAINVTKTLRKALVELQAEQEKISAQIKAIQNVLAAGGSRRGSAKGSLAGRGKRARKSMSEAERKAVSRRMKAYWAKRKAKAAKGRGQGGK
jgi:hypothetical protein